MRGLSVILIVLFWLTVGTGFGFGARMFWHQGRFVMALLCAVVAFYAAGVLAVGLHLERTRPRS